MSKKSRKRNKKILALAGAIGLGMAAKRKRNAAIEKGVSEANADKESAMLASTPPIGGTDHIPKVVVPKAIVDTPKVSVPVGRMRGAGNTDAEAIADQKKRAAYAQNTRDAQADETSVGNYPTASANRRNIRGRLGTQTNYRKDGGRATYKSGGIAKRGVSPILLKGKR